MNQGEKCKMVNVAYFSFVNFKISKTKKGKQQGIEIK